MVGGGALDTTIAGNVGDASTVLRQGVTDVSVIRGRFGAFQRELASSLQVKARTFEQTVAARSRIRDTDFASESAALLRGQLLERAALFTAIAARRSFQTTTELLSVVGRPRELTPERPTQNSL